MPRWRARGGVAGQVCTHRREGRPEISARAVHDMTQQAADALEEIVALPRMGVLLPV